MIVTDHEPMDFRPSWYEAAKRARCTADACQQGRVDCPTPEACRCSDLDDERSAMQMLVYMVIVACIVGAALLFAYI